MAMVQKKVTAFDVFLVTLMVLLSAAFIYPLLNMLAMWEFKFETDSLTAAQEIGMTDLSRNLYVSLRPHGILIEELQNMPMLDKYFAGIKLDAAYVSDLSTRQAEQCGSWLKRRGLGVMVDFASLMDHYPHFSLIRNMPERQDAKLLQMGEIMDKAALLGADRIILTHHRNAENHLSSEEAKAHMHQTISVLCDMAKAHMHQTIGVLCDMAKARGLNVVMMNAVPYAVDAKISDIAAEYPDRELAVNTCHAVMNNDIPTGEQLASAAGLMLSAPLKDEFDQMIDAHMPLYASPMKELIAALLEKADMSKYRFVCLDAVFASFDEMYNEYKYVTAALYKD